MNILSCTLLSLFIGYISLANLAAQEDKVNYTFVKMTCYSIAWSTTTVNQQTPQSIVSLPERLYDKVLVSNRSYLIELRENIKALQQVSNPVEMDIRTVCLLETDKGIIDTLSFGGFEICQYNNKYYYLTWDLFQTIMKKLPPDEAIDFWLQDDPSLKERMIENGKK
jgi:hypothetical protein